MAHLVIQNNQLSSNSIIEVRQKIKRFENVVISHNDRNFEGLALDVVR